MERLSLRELRTLLDVVRDIYAIRSPAAWAQRLLHTLPRLIAVDHLVYLDSEGAADPRAVIPHIIVSDPPGLAARVQEQFAVVEQEHPLGARAGVRWRGEAARISDYWDRPVFRRGRLYNEVFHPLGVEYQMACFAGLPRRVQRLALDRTYRDFTEREVLLLDLLTPHLAEARENAECLGELAAALDGATEALVGLERGVVLLTREGRVRWLSPHAASHLAAYCGVVLESGGRLPELLDRWLRSQQAALARDDDAPSARRPLVLEQGETTLVVRCLSEAEQHCLLLEERRRAPDPAPQYGLTRREAEVLAWVAQGKTNPEIATILDIRPKTVNKHLERIFQKLGVETRTAAAMVLAAAPGTVPPS